jgi:hypothetical protein
MDKLVSRAIVVQRSEDIAHVDVVYKKSKKNRPKLTWSRPLERVARRLVEADIAKDKELLRLHDEGNGRRPDGWIIDGPGIIAAAARKGYNEARKAVPFWLVPKAY